MFNKKLKKRIEFLETELTSLLNRVKGLEQRLCPHDNTEFIRGHWLISAGYFEKCTDCGKTLREFNNYPEWRTAQLTKQKQEIERELELRKETE